MFASPIWSEKSDEVQCKSEDKIVFFCARTFVEITTKYRHIILLFRVSEPLKSKDLAIEPIDLFAESETVETRFSYWECSTQRVESFGPSYVNVGS
jgi:hypothetical protein